TGIRRRTESPGNPARTEQCALPAAGTARLHRPGSLPDPSWRGHIQPASWILGKHTSDNLLLPGFGPSGDQSSACRTWALPRTCPADPPTRGAYPHPGRLSCLPPRTTLILIERPQI